MKTLLLALVLVSPTTYSQESAEGDHKPLVEVIPYEKLSEHNLSEQKIDELSALSKDHVVKSSENQITPEELELIDVELVYEQDPIIFSKTKSLSLLIISRT